MRVIGEFGTYTEEIWMETEERYQIIPITEKVIEIINKSGIIDGIVLVNPMHITASVYVNDLESGLHSDIMSTLEQLAPYFGPSGKSGPEYLLISISKFSSISASNFVGLFLRLRYFKLILLIIVFCVLKSFVKS